MRRVTVQTSCESRSEVCIILGDYGIENGRKCCLESYWSLCPIEGVLGAEQTVTPRRYEFSRKQDSAKVDKMFRTNDNDNDTGSVGLCRKASYSSGRTFLKTT